MDIAHQFRIAAYYRLLEKIETNAELEKLPMMLLTAAVR